LIFARGAPRVRLVQRKASREIFQPPTPLFKARKKNKKREKRRLEKNGVRAIHSQLVLFAAETVSSVIRRRVDGRKRRGRLKKARKRNVVSAGVSTTTESETESDGGSVENESRFARR
jgi:hypothetical protein